MKKIFTLFVFLQGATFAFSQTTVQNDTTATEATKGVFAQLKTELNSTNSNLSTVLIILAVLFIVGIAMYISFKEPDKTVQKSKK